MNTSDVLHVPRKALLSAIPAVVVYNELVSINKKKIEKQENNKELAIQIFMGLKKSRYEKFI